MMHAEPVVVHYVFSKHKATWSDEEKKLVHEKLNRHHIGDGDDTDDISFTEIMCMIYVDGIRDGRR